MWFIALLPLAALVALKGRHKTKNGNSAREDDMDKTDTPPAEDLRRYGRVGQLLEALGWRYTWGGFPKDWDDARALGAAEKGVFDCSGFVCHALQRLGIWPAKWGAFHHVTSSMAWDSDPVEWGKQVPGDIAYYPGHVMLVASFPREDGDSEVLGASGGDHTTHGDKPTACVKLCHSAKYRSDFITFMRPKTA